MAGAMAYTKLHTGLYVVVEGIDGSGKSTLADALYKYLLQQAYPAVYTREPGGTDVGAHIRHMLHAGVGNAQAEFLLFAADRSLHMQNVVIPYRDDGYIVISDRGADSSYAYQGYGRGLSTQMIQSVNRWSMQEQQSDITVYLRMDPSRMDARLAQREGRTAIEQEREAFFERVHAGFEEIYAQRENVITVDAHQTQEDVLEDVLSQLLPYITRIQE